MEEKDNWKVEYAKVWRALNNEKQLVAERRGCELADEFTRLEVQIAAFLLAFTGFMADKLGQIPETQLENAPNLFIAAIGLIVLSLVLGLLHLKRKEYWWDKFSVERHARMEAWDDVILGNKTFEEARAFGKGTIAGRTTFVASPKWTWVLQTISLGVAVAFLALIFVNFILAPSPSSDTITSGKPLVVNTK